MSEGALVFCLLDTVPQLALSRFYAPYEQATRGAPPFDPAMRVCLWLSAYWVGGFSSRTSALAGERHLACIALVGQERPDFRTISAFRKRHLEACKDVCVQVVRLAGEAGWVQWGHVATEGTQIQGHAARHKARSDGSRQQAVERLREAMEALVTQASQQDAAEAAAVGRRRGDAWPAALARREDRLGKIEAAMPRWEAHATGEAEAARPRRAEAAAERSRTGKKRRGQTPQPVVDTPDDQAQSHCTAPEWPSMGTHNKGWEYGGTAHARVDAACQILLACDVTEATNDNHQAEPVAQATLAHLAQAGLERPKDASGAAQAIPATVDHGSDSAAAVEALEHWGCDPYSATERHRHSTPGGEASDPPATAQERMAAQVRPPQGRAWYARRKVIVAPVFGQIQEDRGCRRLLRRGWANIRGAWRWVCLTHHVLKIWRHAGALRTVSADERLSDVPHMALCRASGLRPTERFCPKPRPFQRERQSVHTHRLAHRGSKGRIR